MLDLRHQDVAECIRSLPDNSLQCVICDPPFGLGEEGFDRHYARNADHVVQGYHAAPTDAKGYAEWTRRWLHEIPRVLRPDGTFYVVCAWNHVCDVEGVIRAAPAPGLTVLNHIIWKYNFGVYAQKKFVSSHYHILRCGVGKKDATAFYSRAFFDESEKTPVGKSAQYADLEDVWTIGKEYAPNQEKNVNKLPDALVRKMVLYSSAPGDVVADFFMGNFTTAFVARQEGRKVVGCEINGHAYGQHAERVLATPLPDDPSANGEKPSAKPANARKAIAAEIRVAIRARYSELLTEDPTATKRERINVIGAEFGRGYFSVLNVLNKSST